MLARLWWKEARLFWPIAAFLAVVCVVAHWLAIYYYGDDARSGALIVMAFGWTCLYGFAVAAASLAGERENRTLQWLDALPVARWRLWWAKASFAIVSTLALGLVLSGYAYIYTKTLGALPQTSIFVDALVLLLLVVGWGLFWSAICAQALWAAALAVCSAAFVAPFLDRWLSVPVDLHTLKILQIPVGVAAMLASGVLFSMASPPRRPLMKRRNLASEQVVKSYEAARRSSRRSAPGWPRAAGSLAWQTMREIGWHWWRLVLIGLVVPAILFAWVNGGPGLIGDPGFRLIFVLGVGIAAGVNIFGTEYGATTRRFLANHGVRPSLIWFVKTAFWFAALLPIWLLPILFLRVPGGPFGLVAAISCLCTTAAVGQLCGMIFNRGITAGMIAVVVLIAMVPSLALLFGMNLITPWTLSAIPIIILLVSLAWSCEWLMARPGASRWIKLAGYLCIGFGALFAGHAIERAYNVPGLDPVTEARLFTLTTVPRSNAEAGASRDFYETVQKSHKPASVTPQGSVARRVLETGWDLTQDAEVAYLHDNKSTLELLHRASALPPPEVCRLDRATIFSGLEPVSSAPVYFTTLLALSMQSHQAQGDLTGSWEDLMTMFRMARQWSGEVPLAAATSGLHLEREALNLAMLWAADPRQTTASLRTALEDYQKLPPMPNAAGPVRAEARILRNTVELPRSKLAEEFLAMRGQSGSVRTWEKFRVDLMTLPWELSRARKALTLLFASKLSEAESELWESSDLTRRHFGWFGFREGSGSHAEFVYSETLQELFESTPFVQFSFPALESFLEYWARNEVARRALVQILALRSWQTKHGGRLPEKLSKIVPSEIDRLPGDPYRKNSSFGYVRASGQSLLLLGEFETYSPRGTGAIVRPIDDAWLLYSVGPDLTDDRAQKDDSTILTRGGDFIFPLPDPNPVPKQK
jgi:hypothetical protein